MSRTAQIALKLGPAWPVPIVSLRQWMVATVGSRRHYPQARRHGGAMVYQTVTHGTAKQSPDEADHEGRMIFTSIRKYKVRRGSADELARRARRSFVPLIRQMQGLLSA